MFSEIKFPGGFRVPEVSSRPVHAPAGRTPQAGGSGQDRFQLSPRPTGQEAQVREAVSQIATKARIRPSLHELEALKQQIREGTYQPDAREIAARMLMTEYQEGGL